MSLRPSLEPERIELSVHRERAVLVGVTVAGRPEFFGDPLGELAALARTAGACVVDRVRQRRSRIDPALYLGRGKAEALAQRVKAAGAQVVIFDNDLSPAQIRGLEEIVRCKVLDRSELILDIFASHARTHQSRIAVELAQLQYTAPRLRGMWTHLERIAGAGGATGAGAVGGIGTRGPGERQIEIDRRLVRTRITQLKRKLGEIDRRKLREVRGRRDCFSISLVGYTNAGKSTLFNTLTGGDQRVEDKLFATLDTKTRRWEIAQGRPVLLSDTVGFISHLPHHLVASFQATLEEAIHADLLLHVVDASSGQADHQFRVVNEVLSELGCDEIPTLVLLNKLDAVEDESILNVLEQSGERSLRISARTGQHLDELVDRVEEILQACQVQVTLQVDVGAGKALSRIDRHGRVTDRRYDGSTVDLDVRIDRFELNRILDAHGEVTVLSECGGDTGGSGRFEASA